MAQRPSNRRLPSAPWSRLMPTTDALDQYGLPSKGETRLHDYKAQEAYYQKIVERYMAFCASAGGVDELEAQFSKVDISASTNDAVSRETRNFSPSSLSNRLQKQPPQVKSQALQTQQLHLILHAMRKLREAIVASARADVFAQRVYLFIIRTSILLRQREAYHPALLHLLGRLHRATPLTGPEKREFASYLILDLACRQDNLGAAYETRVKWNVQDRKVDRILTAIVRGDWIAFWKVRRVVDGHVRALMDWHAQTMREHALKCLGKTYFTTEKSYLEACTGMSWADLVGRLGVGWELQGHVVTMRRAKAKT